MDMRRRLATIQKRSDEGMIEYINRGTMLRYELGQLGQEPSEADLVTALLTGLPSTYATTVELLESGGIPSLRTATERLMAAEVKRLGTADKGHDNRPVAYAAGAGEGRFEQGMGERLCFHCERPGHIRRYCPERRRKDGGGSGLAMAVVGSRMEPKWAGTSQEASGSKWVPDWSGSPLGTEWIIDSGASHHITGDISLLHDRTSVPAVQVQMPNGSTAATNVSGMVNLPVWTANGSTTLTLRKVLYVEGMEVNLFSVQAIMQHGYGATFTNGNVSINRGSSRVLDGVRAGTMHVLPTAGSWGKNRADNDCYLAAAAVGADVWHRRLGHCGLTDLKDVARATSGMRVTGKGIKNALRKGCKPCRLAKPVRAPFSTSSSSTSRFLELIHTDVAGPMPHVSIGGARYWVTVIDDHTKLAAVVPIQGKDETGAAVRRIVALWENSSGLKLGRMRSDRGGEYIETGLQVWLAEKGVQHEKTAPYSPQQNGTAERYNRTLEEHTVAMLADGNVDGKLWADAALTANYTLNRIPRRREAKTPYEMVFGMRPNVGHLRTFGCKAYVLTPGPLRRKLAQRTKMGTFIGYEAGSKAYRFLIGGRVVVRRDARFEEEDLYGLEGDSESSHEYSDEDDTDNTGPPGGGLGDAGDGAGSSGGGADGTNPPSEGGDVGGGGGPPQDTGDAGGSPPSAADTLHGGKRGGAAGPRGRDSGGSQDALVGEPPRGGAAPLSSIAEAVAAAEVLFGLTPGKAGDADADGEGGRATTADVGGAPEAGGGLAEAAEAAAALMRELEL